MSSYSIAQTALEYQARGFSVLPVDRKTKRPLVESWREYQTRQATTEEVQQWWRRWPQANVAIVTGAVSGLVVVDVDGPEGEAALRGKHLPPTPCATTGKGKHYYFAHPGGQVPNAVRLLPGVDLRADGGFVVAPPSRHASGRRYEWVDCLSIAEVPLAPCPAWLLDLVRQPHPSEEKPKLDPLRVLAGVPEGERDNTLFRYACRLRQQGLTKEEATRLVLEAAKNCKPPFPEKQALLKVESAWRYDRPETFHPTDLGNAQRLVAAHGQDLRYCHPWGKWLVWNGQQWQVDNTAEVMRRAKDTVRGMYGEAAHIDNEKERREFLQFVLKSESRDRLAATVTLAASEPGIPVLPGELDRDPWLLNCANGTVDLRTGELRPHRREDMLSKMTPVAYDPEAACPRWEAFLERIMAGNERLITFLQRAVGYSLTASTREQVFFLLYGTGANGKSVFLTTLQAVLGDYATQAAPDLLLAKKGERHPTEVADLLGKRLVVATETESGRRLAESLVKQLTGGDKLKARRMREDFFEFEATHKLWLATNHKPRVRGTDYAIWRRIRLIPFNVTIPVEEQDKSLPDKLREELPGILRWAVEGCLAWQREGLGVPDEVKAATDAYRQEQDVLAAFLEDCCIINPLAKAAAKDIYQTYLAWCEENGERPMSQRDLGMQLTERGFDRFRGGKSGGIVWRGIGLLTEGTERTEPDFRLNKLAPLI
ncbi:MAG: DNA primase [Clostridia bacterium]|nr:MAG: DNA primase [Clostridia bacterium]